MGLAGSAGAFAGYRTRVPAGVLLGALVGVGGTITALGVDGIQLPRQVGSGLQILVGLMVGARMTRSSFASGAKLILPAGLVAGLMLATGIGAALLAVRLASISFETALFAAVPGGMTEMTTVAASVGADGVAVAAVQLSRLLTAIVMANFLLMRLGVSRRSRAHSVSTDERSTGGRSFKGLEVASLAALAGGVVGLASGAPGGALVGSLLATAAVRLSMPIEVPIRALRVGIQGLAGVLIGLGVDRAFFEELGRLGTVAAIVIASQLLLWVVTGYILTRVFRGDRITALFSSGPGGMSEMIGVSDQAGADVVVVSFVHLVRVSSIIVLVPTVIVPY